LGWRRHKCGLRGCGHDQSGLAHGQRSVVVDDGVVTEVGAGSYGDDRISSDWRRAVAAGGFGEGEGVTVDCSGCGGGENWVSRSVSAVGVGCGDGQHRLAYGECAVVVDDGVITEVGTGNYGDDGISSDRRCSGCGGAFSKGEDIAVDRTSSGGGEDRVGGAIACGWH